LAIASSIANAAGRPVSFSKDIQPIIAANCWTSLGAALQLSKLDLCTRESVSKDAEHSIILARQLLAP
jgi:hypothetical protein